MSEAGGKLTVTTRFRVEVDRARLGVRSAVRLVDEHGVSHDAEDGSVVSLVIRADVQPGGIDTLCWRSTR